MQRRTIVLVLLLLGSLALLAIPVTGRVRVTGRTGGSANAAVVYAESLGSNVRPQEGRFTLRQIKKAFQPRLLVVPVGSTVQFPNEDSLFHNVFSLNKPEPFDLGQYRSGQSKNWTFTAPGTYNVFCNIHPQMAAMILVVPTSYIAQVDAGGNYKLDLPAGRYRITAVSERAQPVSTEVTVGSTAPAIAELVLNEPKDAPAQHTDKFGKEYPKASYSAK
jgi:plastocyanin